MCLVMGSKWVGMSSTYFDPCLVGEDVGWVRPDGEYFSGFIRSSQNERIIPTQLDGVVGPFLTLARCCLRLPNPAAAHPIPSSHFILLGASPTLLVRLRHTI